MSLAVIGIISVKSADEYEVFQSSGPLALGPHGAGTRPKFSILNATELVVPTICHASMNCITAMPLKNLSREKCLVGLEIYKNKGVWKLKAVGAGYNGKLRTLCESFGVEIE